MYLSSYCAIGLPWRRRLKDPLLLLWGQRGIQWNDFYVANFRSKVIDLTLDPLAGLIDFLQETHLSLCFAFLLKKCCAKDKQEAM